MFYLLLQLLGPDSAALHQVAGPASYPSGLPTASPNSSLATWLCFQDCQMDSFILMIFCIILTIFVVVIFCFSLKVMDIILAWNVGIVYFHYAIFYFIAWYWVDSHISVLFGMCNIKIWLHKNVKFHTVEKSPQIQIIRTHRLKKYPQFMWWSNSPDVQRAFPNH